MRLLLLLLLLGVGGLDLINSDRFWSRLDHRRLNRHRRVAAIAHCNFLFLFSFSLFFTSLIVFRAKKNAP